MRTGERIQEWWYASAISLARLAVKFSNERARASDGVSGTRKLKTGGCRCGPPDQAGGSGTSPWSSKAWSPRARTTLRQRCCSGSSPVFASSSFRTRCLDTFR